MSITLMFEANPFIKSKVIKWPWPWIKVKVKVKVKKLVLHNSFHQGPSTPVNEFRLLYFQKNDSCESILSFNTEQGLRYSWVECGAQRPRCFPSHRSADGAGRRCCPHFSRQNHFWRENRTGHHRFWRQNWVHEVENCSWILAGWPHSAGSLQV